MKNEMKFEIMDKTSQFYSAHKNQLGEECFKFFTKILDFIVYF